MAPNVEASDSHFQASLDPEEEEEGGGAARGEQWTAEKCEREESEKEKSARVEDEGWQQVQGERSGVEH